jgi:hypothetical protein
MRRTLFVFGALAIGCGDNGIPPPSSTPPAAPAQNDPTFAISGLRQWYLVGDNLTPGDDTMTIAVVAPAGAAFVDAYVAKLPPVRMAVQSDGRFTADIAIGDVPPGTQTIVFSSNGADVGFATTQFHRSAAYYVMVSTDYDFPDPGTYAIGYMDWMHRDHAGMRITHFWAPYTYTDPSVTDARRDELTQWVLAQHAMFGDEIGLHIHPYCTFVVDAGLPCITDQSDVYPGGDTSGYTIIVAAYGHDNFSLLLRHAALLFANHGIAQPKTFRAGGWTADTNTFHALADNGYIADTSALNWKYIQAAWKGKLIASWTAQQWAPIDDTSQPYYPPTDSVLPAAGAELAMLEVPDNGVMIDYVSLDDINRIFDENWQAQPLAQPRTLMMGFHPATGFTSAEYARVDGFLHHADQFLHATDLGPVVYTTLSDVTTAFPHQ